MFCGNCGTKLDDVAKFCPQCGKSVEMSCSSVPEHGREVMSGTEETLMINEESDNEESEASESSEYSSGEIMLLCVGHLLWITGVLNFISVLLRGVGIPFFTYPATLVGGIMVTLVSRSHSKRVAYDTLQAMKRVRINLLSVQKGMEKLGDAINSRFVICFSKTEDKSVKGLKLQEGEEPILLFGTNSKLGVVSMTGWSGILFTNLGLHYKLAKSYSRCAEGYVPYERICQMAVLGDDVEAYFSEKTIDVAYFGLNGKNIGMFKTSSEGVDAEAFQALVKFCDDIVEETEE